MARKAIPNESLLSIADISRRFSLPESTTRYYCKRFAAFIPSVGEGRRRRFRPETLDVIAAILDQMQKSRTAAAVEDILQSRFPRNALAVAQATPPAASAGAHPDFFSAAVLQLLERQTLAMEGISQLMHHFIERLPLAAAPADTVNTEDNQALRKEVETLRTLLHASEKTQQADLDQLRQWMRKVILNRSKAAAQTAETV